MPGLLEAFLRQGYGYMNPYVGPRLDKARNTVPLVDRAARKAEDIVPRLIAKADEFAEPRVERLRPYIEPRIEQVKVLVNYGMKKVEQIQQFRDILFGCGAAYKDGSLKVKLYGIILDKKSIWLAKFKDVKSQGKASAKLRVDRMIAAARTMVAIVIGERYLTKLTQSAPLKKFVQLITFVSEKALGEEVPAAQIDRSMREMQQSLIIEQVFDLPEIAQALGTVCCDPSLLAQLSLTQTHLHTIISSANFATYVADELHNKGVLWAKGCKSLEEIAVGMAVEKICAQGCKNHLYFQFGGGTEVRPLTRPLLDKAASLVRRHPRVRLHADSHVGATAPRGLAVMISQRRATSVMNDLIARGVAEERITIRAWGRIVSSVWSEPEDDTAARAELFFNIGNVQFPMRAAYYNLVPQEDWPAMGGQEAHSPASSDDEGGTFQLRANEGRLVQLPSGQVIPVALIHRIIQARQNDESEDDSDDGSEAGADDQTQSLLQ